MSEPEDSKLHPDYDRAIAYALGRLHGELPAHLHYHSPWHTEGDVLPAVRQLAALAGLAEHDVRLLEVAAAFHDIGHIRQQQGHEEIGIEIMAAALPRFGFGHVDIERMAGIIRATRMPQSPTNQLECLMADADLDGLGRSDFLTTCTALWREQSALGQPCSWPDWLQSQLSFLRAHHYFTPAAIALRESGQRNNIALLEELLSELGSSPGGEAAR